MQLTEREKRTIENGEVVRLVEADVEYVVVRADLYDRVKGLLYDPSEPSPSQSYALVDEVMREDWDDPKMAEYDSYEAHRP